MATAQAAEHDANLFDCATDCKALAECYYNLKDVQNSIEYYTIAKALYDQMLQNNPPSDDGFGCINPLYTEATRLLAEVNFHIGDIYYLIGDKDTTIEYVAPAIEIALDLANLTDEKKRLDVACYLLLLSWKFYIYRTIAKGRGSATNGFRLRSI